MRTTVEIFFAEKLQGLKEKFANRNKDILVGKGKFEKRKVLCFLQKSTMTMKVIAKIDLHSFPPLLNDGSSAFVHTVAQIGFFQHIFW